MTAQALILSGQDWRAEIKRWSLAAAVVVATHVGLLGTYLLLPAPAQHGAPIAPAVIIELAPLAVAPSSPMDIAPGPEMEEAQPPPETQPQPEPEVKAEPKIEAPAEVLLPLPEPKVEQKPEEKPEIKKTEPEKVERKPPAPRTTAAPRSEQRTAERPAAPSPGSEASRAAIASWRSQVVARLQSVKRYPSGADGSGTVLVNFTVDRSGQVIARSVARSSGNSAFDQEALAMVARASPFPPVPAAIAGASVHLPVPINFARR
jgi:protein TonB